MRQFIVIVFLSLLVLMAAACGPVDEQQVEEIISGVAQTAAAGVTFVPATPAGPTPDVNIIVQQTFSAMTAQAPVSSTGSIAGQLNYPAEGIYAQKVVAFHVGSADYSFITTQSGQSTYQIDNLPPGVYHVVAYTLDGSLAAGYSQAVPCGLNVNCTDHSLIDVTVNAGQVAGGVNPIDWYAVQGTYPAMPSAGGATDNIPTNTPPGGLSGGIAGNLTYPAERIPAMAVITYATGGGQNNYYYVITNQGQNTYQIDNLPIGTYTVVAYSLGGGGFPAGLAGGYTQAVPCGLSVSCTDHSLIPVQVNNGVVTQNINPGDWYAPKDSFPADPLS